MVKKIAAALIGLMVFCITNTILANILVSPTIINFLPGKLPRKDIVVMNQGDNNAYIAVTPYLVEHPGTKREKKVRIHNPAKLGLLVSPSKFIIPPKQHRTLRIMHLSKHLKKDKIYRITVAPIPNKLLPTAVQRAQKNRIGIRIIAAYGILATARPDQMKPMLIAKRDKKLLTIENRGNSNIVIVSGKQCMHGKCFKLPPRRMYAGNTWTVKLKFNKPVDITTDYLGERQHIKSN